MTRKIFFPLILLISILIFYNYYANPPDGYTGAPVKDELSCTVCHFFDSKHIKGTIEIVGLPTKITPGNIYPISFNVNNTDKRGARASFQLVSLFNEKNAGVFTNPGSNVYFSTYKERTYAESHPGIELVDNRAEFTFNWKAPNSPDNGIISFYAIGMIADGDNTYVNDAVIKTSAHGVLGNSLNVNCIEQVNNACINDSSGFAKMEASGGKAPYNYTWANGHNSREISNLKAGVYYVTVTDDDGTNGIGFVKITEPELLEITEVLKKEYISGIAGSIELSISGGSGKYSYEWTKDNNFFSNEKNIYNLLPGCYNLVLEDSCKNVIDSTICILDLSKTENENNDQIVNVFPIPAKDYITIECKNINFTKCKIIDKSGQVVLKKSISQSKETINISNLNSDIYFLKLTNKKKTHTEKIFIL